MSDRPDLDLLGRWARHTCPLDRGRGTCTDAVHACDVKAIARAIPDYIRSLEARVAESERVLGSRDVSG